MGVLGLDDLDTWSENMSAAPQESNEASPYPWPGTSCVSSPYANRVGTLQAFGAAVQRGPAQLFRGPAVLDSPAAKERQHAGPPAQRSAPLGCILVDPDSVSPALCHDRHMEPPASPVPHAEKENNPSPERIHLSSQAAPPLVPAEVQPSREGTAGFGSGVMAHRQAPLHQALQQASQSALGAPAHHSLQLPPPSKQDQSLKPRPASAQGCRGEASVVKQAVKAFSRHTAPEECDPLLTRFAWNLDQQGQPDSIAHLRSSGIFPEQGPLGEGQEALQRLSYSSSASAASMAQRAQRLDDEAMLYMSHSSSNDSARTGRLGGDLPLHPMQTSSDSSAHPFQISLEDGMPARNAPCAAETAIPVGPLQAQMCFRGVPCTEPQVQPASLMRSSCISAMPWDLSRSEGQAARVPAVPRHLATPSLMGRAGDPTYYDEPELGRITPPAEHPPSRFTLAEGVDDTAQAKPSRPKLPPVPAHLRGLLTHSSAKQGSRASLQPLPAASVQTGPEPVPTSCLAPRDAKQPAAELHAAILQQAAKLKPTKRLHTPEMPAQAINQTYAAKGQECAIERGQVKPVQAKPPPPPPVPIKAPKQARATGSQHRDVSANRSGLVSINPIRPPAPPPVPAQAHKQQKQALEPHEAAMNAIRSGQFKLRPVEVPRQQTTPAADAKDALMNAIKNRQYSLKPVSTTTVPKAGAEGRDVAMGKAVDDMKLRSPLAGLHAIIRERTAGMRMCSESSSNGTGWEA